MPALVELDAPHGLAHPGQDAVVQVVEQRILSGLEDDPLEHHVVEAYALAQSPAARRELGGQRGEALLEELEHRGGDVGSGGGAPLGRGRAGQPEHLGGDAVEDQRVALLVAALQEEDPGHQGLRRGERGAPGDSVERLEVLRDGVLGHAEAGEQRGEAPAALLREARPSAGIRG